MRSLSTAHADADIAAFEEFFRSFLTAHANDNPLHQQIEHHFALAGKRLRPRLLLAAAQSFGVDAQTCFPACTAIELLHNYSLIHDDIEDGDKMRHGRPALWSAYGMAHGINAGDAVGALAQLALAPLAGSLGSQSACAMSGELARANLEMCEGQALDLASAGSPDAGMDAGMHARADAGIKAGAGINPGAWIDAYLQMIGAKTGALFGCAAAFGARCGKADAADLQRCARIGRLYGLGFQIQDDIDGIWRLPEHTGKPASDIARRKATYPIAWAKERGGADVARLIDTAYRQAGGALSAQSVERIREALDASGARQAAQSAADTYFEAALQLADDMRPLCSYIGAWRPDTLASGG